MCVCFDQAGESSLSVSLRESRGGRMRGKYRRDAFPGRPCKGTYNQAGAGRGGKVPWHFYAVSGHRPPRRGDAQRPGPAGAEHVPRGR
jgi:hypothetical protein